MTPLVVIVPFAGQFPDGLAGVATRYGMPEGAVAPETPQRLLHAWVSARDIPSLDLTATVRREGVGRVFGARDKHFSVEGHRIVGTAVADYLLTHSTTARAQRRSSSP